MITRSSERLPKPVPTDGAADGTADGEARDGEAPDGEADGKADAEGKADLDADSVPYCLPTVMVNRYVSVTTLKLSLPSWTMISLK